MEAVEHADDDEDPSESRRQALDPLDDVHASRRTRPPARPPGSRRPCRVPGACHRQWRSPRGGRPGHAAGSGPRAGPAGPPAGRTYWPRATAASSTSVNSMTGKASRPSSIGRRSGTMPSGPSAAAARMSSSGVAAARSNGPDAMRVRAPRYAALPTASPRSRAIARTYVPAEQATSTIAIGRSAIGRVPVGHGQLVERHLALGQDDRLTGPGHGVRTPATDLDRAVGGRTLRDHADHRRQGGLDGLT